MEEDLRGDIVRIVAYHSHVAAGEYLSEVEPEEVFLQDPALQFWHIIVEPADTFAVDFHYLQVRMDGEQEAGEYAHARPNFNHGELGIRREGISYALGHVEVGQEVLPKGFLRSYGLHGGLAFS